ncbi:hypothetical protein J7J62_03985 [bacterium]|nr:hypothetical protein [bacterium]
MKVKPTIKAKIKIFVKEGRLLIDATTASYIAKNLLKNICPFLESQLKKEDTLVTIYAKKPKILQDNDYYIYYYKIKYKNGKEIEIGVKDDFIDLPIVEVHMITYTGVEFQIWPVSNEIDQINNLLSSLEKCDKVVHLKVWFSNAKIVKYKVTFTDGMKVEKVIEDIEVKKDTIIKAFEDGKQLPYYSFKVQKAYEILKQRYSWIKNIKEIKMILKGNKIMKYDISFGNNNSISVSNSDGIDIYSNNKNYSLPKPKKVQEKKEVKKILIRIPKGYEKYITNFELSKKDRNSLIGKIPIDKLNDKIMFLI